eukprot:TRINITY_DN16224_c0_g1_i1.p2 TRINITY_DN16224_c0_g1~~TRINITY_DN16224_c0_g1_i1.p2  ORF type:complete len:186 (+),score=81.84 TRINITY_DN16224_c0_g1_i1:265-822(+)
MELCSNTVQTLKAVGAGDDVITTGDLSTVALFTLQELAGERGDESQAATVQQKNVHSALAVLYLEGAKAAAEASDLAETLEGVCDWKDADKLSAVTGGWAAQMPAIRSKLVSLAPRDPSVVSSSWSAHHVLGDREVATPTKSHTRFHLTLDLSDKTPFTFSCTAEQMQVFGEKLRDMLAESQRAH